MGKFYARHRTSFSHTHSKRMCHGRHLCWCNDALVAGAVPVAWTRTAPGSIRRCWFIVCFSFLRMAIGAPGRQQVRKRDSKIYIFARGLVRKSHCFVRFFSVSLKTDPARIVDICAEVFEGPLVCVLTVCLLRRSLNQKNSPCKVRLSTEKLVNLFQGAKASLKKRAFFKEPVNLLANLFAGSNVLSVGRGGA